MSENSVNNYNSQESDEASENDDYSQADPTSYYRTVSLRYFAARPLQMVSEHGELKEMCLEAGNPEAQYIEGLLQYFHHKEERTGLKHLRYSLKNKNGTYAYGILMLAHGHYCKGTKYLGKLPWRSNIAMSDRCWERMKNSLRAIPVQMTQRYYTNWVKTFSHGRSVASQTTWIKYVDIVTTTKDLPDLSNLQVILQNEDPS